MGIVSGIVILFGVYLSTIDFLSGFKLLACISGALSVVFAMRLFRTKKFMPAGMLLTMSIIALVVSSLQLIS